MSKQSDPRSYSVDEMLEKLKEGEREKRRSEDSELVTRPDGSQVVRVRRRKRRSNQPQKTKQVRQRRYGLLALLLLATVLILLVATVLILLARFNSNGYRESLKEQMLNATGANVGITDLVVRPTRARAQSVEFAWPAGGIAKTLKLEDLEARLEPGSFISSQWKGGEVLASSGVMVLGPPDGTIITTVQDEEFPLDYNSYRCSNLELLFGDTIDEPALHLRSAELTLRQRKEGGFQLLLHGGTARLGSWDNLKVDRGLAELRDGRFDLNSLRFEVPPEGVATLKTTKPLVAGSTASLEVKLEKYPLDHLLGASAGFGTMLNATIDVPAGKITADPRDTEAGSVHIEFTGTEATLARFRFLTRLSSMLNKIYYANPDRGTVEGTFRKSKEGVRIDDFKFEANTQLIVRGNMAANPGGELSGSLKVGVPEVLMMVNQTRRRYVAFSHPDAGYCWIDLNLKGTLENPQDDFFEVLQKANDAVAPKDPRDSSPQPAPNPGITPLTPPTEPIPAPAPAPGPGGAAPEREPQIKQAPSNLDPRSRQAALEDTFERLTK